MKSIAAPLALVALLLTAVSAASETAKQVAEVQIALSSASVTGLMIGAVLVGMLFFSVNMLQGIRISEVPDLPLENN